MRLAGKTAIVTGAGRGVGKAIALALAREGADLALASRTRSEVEATARDVRLAGRRALAILADISQRQEAEAMVASALAEFGTVDILVNNASVQPPIGRLWENDPDEWLRTVLVNLGGAFLCCRAVIPAMIRNGGGKIMNLSGGGATSPRPFFSAYASSKTALVRLTETLAEELRPYNVQVNAIAPGMVATRMIHEILVGDSVEGEEEMIKARELAQTEDASLEKVADLIIFLASRESDGFTGRLVSAIWDDWEQWRVGPDPLPAEGGTLRRVPLGPANGDGDFNAASESAFRGFPGQTNPDASDRAATILRLLRGQKATRFLDIGCGDGQLTASAGEAVSADEIHGVDLNPEMIQLAQEKGVLAVRADLDREPLPYPSNFFDLALASEVIEHIYDPGSLLAEVRRVLVPGGKFIVTTPNLASWHNRLALLLGFQPWLTAASLYDPGAGKLNLGTFLTKVGTVGGDHLRVITLKALRDIAVAHGFTPAGFHVVSTTRLFDARTPFIMRIPLWLIQNTLGRFPALSSTLIVQLVANKENGTEGDG